MAIDQTSQLGVLRSRAIALNRSFQPVRPLVARSRMVSLNARCAITQAGPRAAPLQVVATELASLGASLRALIDDVEESFTDVARTVANLVRNEERLTKYASALEHLEEPITGDEAIAAALTNRSGIEWNRRVVGHPAHDARTMLWRALLAARGELLADLHSLQNWARHIDNKTTALQENALTQGFFIGFNATVEAARLGEESGGIGAVAEDITSYAKHMASAIAIVAVQVREFTEATADAVRPIRAEIRRPIPTG